MSGLSPSLPRLLADHSRPTVLTKEQRRLFDLVRTFVNDNLTALSPNARLELPATLAARDRRFLSDLGEALRLELTYDEFDADGHAIIVLSFDEEMLAMAREESAEEETKEGEAEWQKAIGRVLRKYEKAETAKDFDEHEWEAEHAKVLEEKMATWKNDYYRVRRAEILSRD